MLWENRFHAKRSPPHLELGSKPLLAALENGSIQGAAFDAFTSANLGGEYGDEMVGDYPRDCPLWDHPQVIITPHTSASTRRPFLLSLSGEMCL